MPIDLGFAFAGFTSAMKEDRLKREEIELEDERLKEAREYQEGRDELSHQRQIELIKMRQAGALQSARAAATKKEAELNQQVTAFMHGAGLDPSNNAQFTQAKNTVIAYGGKAQDALTAMSEGRIRTGEQEVATRNATDTQMDYLLNDSSMDSAEAMGRAKAAVGVERMPWLTYGHTPYVNASDIDGDYTYLDSVVANPSDYNVNPNDVPKIRDIATSKRREASLDLIKSYADKPHMLQAAIDSGTISDPKVIEMAKSGLAGINSERYKDMTLADLRAELAVTSDEASQSEINALIRVREDSHYAPQTFFKEDTTYADMEARLLGAGLTGVQKTLYGADLRAYMQHAFTTEVGNAVAEYSKADSLDNVVAAETDAIRSTALKIAKAGRTSEPDFAEIGSWDIPTLEAAIKHSTKAELKPVYQTMLGHKKLDEQRRKKYTKDDLATDFIEHQAILNNPEAANGAKTKAQNWLDNEAPIRAATLGVDLPGADGGKLSGKELQIKFGVEVLGLSLEDSTSLAYGYITIGKDELGYSVKTDLAAGTQTWLPVPDQAPRALNSADDLNQDALYTLSQQLGMTPKELEENLRVEATEITDEDSAFAKRIEENFANINDPFGVGGVYSNVVRKGGLFVGLDWYAEASEAARLHQTLQTSVVLTALRLEDGLRDSNALRDSLQNLMVAPNRFPTAEEARNAYANVKTLFQDTITSNREAIEAREVKASTAANMKRDNATLEKMVYRLDAMINAMGGKAPESVFDQFEEQ